uniref:BZIP domain-containing protein n=1 Tax=Steinernema glaseri TaxID=37863 RepID=A0A1I7XVQ9_9BILA
MFLENHDNGAPPASQVSQLVMKAEKRSADRQKSSDLKTEQKSVSYRTNKIKRHDSRMAESEYVTRSKYDELMKVVEELSNRIVTLEQTIVNKNPN